jgi:hypothetical protein
MVHACDKNGDSYIQNVAAQLFNHLRNRVQDVEILV